jgi:hypothetical protein
MTNTNEQRGTIRWPNRNDAAQGVYQAALREAQSTVGPDEEVVYLQLQDGVAERGNSEVMVWSYTYQILKPGGQAVKRH